MPGKVLADIFTECALEKPENPYLYVAEALYRWYLIEISQLKSYSRAGNEEERMMKKARKNKRADEASIKK